MPIGFWAISRKELKDLLEFRVSQRRPKWKLSTQELEQKVTNLTRTLPYSLNTEVERAIIREIDKG